MWELTYVTAYLLYVSRGNLPKPRIYNTIMVVRPQVDVFDILFSREKKKCTRVVLRADTVYNMQMPIS